MLIDCYLVMAHNFISNLLLVFTFDICLLEHVVHTFRILQVWIIGSSKMVQWFSLYIWCRWFMAYRDALSFRSSHYFVSYLSEATTLAAGIDTSPTRNWTVTVTRPWNVELPRSLVEVVINWNIPMHTWLKNCK